MKRKVVINDRMQQGYRRCQIRACAWCPEFLPPAAAGSPIRLRLGEMERAREPRRAVARAAPGAPMLFQRFPHRSPDIRVSAHGINSVTCEVAAISRHTRPTVCLRFVEHSLAVARLIDRFELNVASSVPSRRQRSAMIDTRSALNDRDRKVRP
jgi:hypothetical protein